MTTDDPQKIKARLSNIAADVRDVYQDAVCSINALQAENRELQAERDEFKDAAFRIKRRLNAKTPRVITADELKEGRTVAYHWEGSTDWEVGTISEAGIPSLRRRPWRFVLLADAPDEQQEPERLTVADLESAWDKGYWHGINGHTGPGNPYRDQNVVPPAPAPVTAETIRQSEPGSTWDDKHGVAWEWTGDGLAYHSQFGDLGEESLTDYVVQQSGPFTRSTAAPRGDYGKQFRMADWEREILEQQEAEKVKAELPTTVGEVILVTEFGGLYDAAEPIGAYRTNGNTWRRLDQEPWPGDYLGLYAPDEEITGWLPAKVVTDD